MGPRRESPGRPQPPPTRVSLAFLARPEACAYVFALLGLWPRPTASSAASWRRRGAWLRRLASSPLCIVVVPYVARGLRPHAPSAFSRAALRVRLGHSPRVLRRLATLGVLLASLRSAHLFSDGSQLMRCCQLDFAICQFLAFKMLKLIIKFLLN